MPPMFRRVTAPNIAVATFCACLSFSPSISQESKPRYQIGISIASPKPECPVFVWGVLKNSPAANAGIRVGDRLTAVDGNNVTSLRDAAEHITSTSSRPVTVQLVRDDRPFSLTVMREDSTVILQNAGLKMLADGTLVNTDTTNAEAEHVLAVSRALENAKDLSTVFPGHYPANEELYYPGFEVFTWDEGNQVTVGGVEDGPAAHAGVRWGDHLVALNGVDPRKKTVAELETLFSSSKPKTMTLVIDRGGSQMKISFELAKAATVLQENGWKIKDGKRVPLWVSEKYLPCFQ
jgi:C-terminal processing protease CtpA/Prc